MKKNYNLIMEDILKNLNGRPKLLLHACCGICSSSVLERLYSYFDITVLYYNPNTYPLYEYKKRYDTLRKLIEKNKMDVQLLEIGYQNEKFDKISIGYENEKEGGIRCARCIELRLDKTAALAKEKGYDYFTTTLSVSPHKNSELINKIGQVLEKKHKIKYLYSDFKKKEGFKRSNELSKKYDLYRQNYCGCKYSLKDVEVRGKKYEEKS